MEYLSSYLLPFIQYPIRRLFLFHPLLWLVPHIVLCAKYTLFSFLCPCHLCPALSRRSSVLLSPSAECASSEPRSISFEFSILCPDSIARRLANSSTGSSSDCSLLDFSSSDRSSLLVMDGTCTRSFSVLSAAPLTALLKS